MTTTLRPPIPVVAGRRYARPASMVTAIPSTTAPDLEHAFAAGHDDAIRAAYEAHGRLVHSICRRSLDEHAAHDVTQEVFVSAWRARDRYDPARGSLAAWLVGIAKRRIIDHLRSEGRHVDRRSGAITDDAVGHGEPGLQQTIDRMVVVDALSTLSERAREAVVLAYVHDLTHDEIAERTGTPLGTVKSDIRRSLQRIKAHLESTHG